MPTKAIALNPKVSIIIPVYNSAAFLAEAIQSALNQTWPEKEIIIVDDGSTDSSLSVARRFESEEVRVYTQENSGAATARNLGLRHATGDYIQYLDADDLLSPDKIEAQIGLLTQSTPGTISSCRWGRFYNDPKTALFTEETVWRNYSKPWQWLRDSWNGGGMMQTACWLIPRSVAEAAGPWNESTTVNDDGEYFCRILLKSEKLIFCPTDGVRYRSSVEGSLCRRTDDSAVDSAFLVCELYEKHMEEAQLNTRFQDALRSNYIHFIYQYHPLRKELMQKAWRHAVRLGGSKVHNTGGKNFQIITHLFGFQNALRLRRLTSVFKKRYTQEPHLWPK